MFFKKIFVIAALAVSLSCGVFACPPPAREKPDLPKPRERVSWWSHQLAFLAYPGSFPMLQAEPPVEVVFQDLDRPEGPEVHYAGIVDMTLTRHSPEEVMAYYRDRFPDAEVDAGAFGGNSLLVQQGWSENGPVPLGSWSVTISVGEEQFRQGTLTSVVVAVHTGLDPVLGRSQTPNKAMQSTLSLLRVRILSATLVAGFRTLWSPEPIIGSGHSAGADWP